MSKKQKRTEPKQVPTKRQLSKWQRQTRMRRIIISVAAVFLIGIAGWVCYGIYNDKIKPSREVALTINDATFNMGYYVKMLDARIKMVERQSGEEMGTDTIYYYADWFIGKATNQITHDELIKQGADDLEISVTDEEIDEKIEEINWPDEQVYRDMIATSLLQEKLLNEYFEPRLNATMNQTHIQVMLVESEGVADSVITKIEGGGNFTELAANFSCNHTVEGDLGWLPQELMPNPLIANVSSSLEPGETGSIYDESAINQTEGGYWIIEVLDKGQHGLSEEVREGLAQNEFDEWFEQQRENSTINNYLDENKKSWAIDRVVQGRQ